MKYINLIASMCLLSHCHVHSTADASLWGHSNKSNVVLEDLLRQKNNNSWCCTLILKKNILNFSSYNRKLLVSERKKFKKDSLKTLIIYTEHCNTSSSKKSKLSSNSQFIIIKLSITKEKYNFLNAKTMI